MRLLIVAFSLCIVGAAVADPPSDKAGTTPLHDQTVFNAFHGKAGIDRVVDDLVSRAVKDPRISDIFKASDLAKLKAQLSDQFCYILAGPCAYNGKTMQDAHKDMGLQDADLNALVEDLQAAMDKEGVPFRAQNKLLAKLAPMRRMVVER
jgi:hemoglobin